MKIFPYRRDTIIMGTYLSTSQQSNESGISPAETVTNKDLGSNNTDEKYLIKDRCHDGQQCNAFVRLINNGYLTDDIEHCFKYFHPGRRGGTTTSENFGSNKFITAYQNYGVNLPIGTGLWNGLVKSGELKQELGKNGCSHAMIVTSELFTTLNDVAQEKLNHPRHQSMGSPLSHDQMLAILLYTDSIIYKDLRHHEMCYSRQDFANTDRCHLLEKKWPILGCVLNSAVWTLAQHDKQTRPATVYHGLNNIEIDPSTFNNHNRSKSMPANTHPTFRYGTFISTSWDRQVALAFMSGTGSLLEIDLDTEEDDGPLVGADVSWISKIPAECEFLIARGAAFVVQSMTFSHADQCQIVRVKQGPVSHNRAKFRRMYS
jgi:hypothetical protein